MPAMGASRGSTRAECSSSPEAHGLRFRSLRTRRRSGVGRSAREITDAAMGVQAECVMLNKGPRILEAISVLDDILRRMERHHRKQRPLMPQLRAADYVHTKLTSPAARCQR